MIFKISFDNIYPIWRDYLWFDRTSPIEPNSAMLYKGKYDLKNMHFQPTFYAFKLNNDIVGVNSGHMCVGNNYRSRGLYVFPEFRKLGIGTELLLATIEQGLTEGASFIWSYPRVNSWTTYYSAGFILKSKWSKSETGDNAYCRTPYIGDFK